MSLSAWGWLPVPTVSTSPPGESSPPLAASTWYKLRLRIEGRNNQQLSPSNSLDYQLSQMWWQASKPDVVASQLLQRLTQEDHLNP